MSNDTTTNSGWWQQLKDKVYDHYQGIVNKIKSPFIGLKNYFLQKENNDAITLNAMRENQFRLIKEESEQPHPDYGKLTQKITGDIKQYMQDMIDDEVKKLGPPPCKFTVATLGSMARGECGPETDLEVAFLIEEKNIENYKYFYALSQRLSDRIFLLGEHPDIGGKGLRMDEADNAPFHRRFFARNLSHEQAQEMQNEAIQNRDKKKMPYEGSRPFLTTYDEFAQFSSPNFTQDIKQQRQIANKAFEKEWEKAKNNPKNKAALQTEEGRKKLRNEIGYWVNQMHRPYSNRELGIANTAGKKLGRNMAHLYGDKPLYDAFAAKKKAHFDQAAPDGKKAREIFTKEKMHDDIAEMIQKGKSVYVNGELDKTLDIKRELYRFVEQFITNLGFYHECESQNCLEIVKELTQKGILSSDFGAQLSDFMQFATGLRLKEQATLKRQGYAAYLDEAEFNDDRTKMEKEITLLTEAISYMESTATPNKEAIDAKKRALVELKDKYDHLLEMAPGKIISQNDLALLKNKYLPIAQDIYKQAQAWTQGTERLGNNPTLPKADKEALEVAIDYVKKQPAGFFPTLTLLKEHAKQLEKPFIERCRNENLIRTKDRIKLTALKAW